MVKFAQFVQEFSQKQKRERKKEMKRTLRQSTAILLAVLMVFSSVGMLGFAVDGEPAAPVWPRATAWSTALRMKTGGLLLSKEKRMSATLIGSRKTTQICILIL